MGRWTKQEENIIQQVFDDPTVEDLMVDSRIADELDKLVGGPIRSFRAIQCKREKMGLQFYKRFKRGWPDTPKVVTQADAGYTKDVIADYVKMGGDLTQQEVARKHGLSVKEVAALLKSAGVTKASLPLSPDELEEGDEDLLVEHVLSTKEQRIARKVEAGYVTRLQTDYRNLLAERMSQDRILEEARRMAEAFKETLIVERHTKVWAEPKEPVWYAHVPTADEHVGSLVWEPEAFGEDYDTKIACERLVRHAYLAAEWITQQPGNCARIYRTFIGDILHSLMGETEHGTKLDQDTRAGRVWFSLMDALRKSVTILAETGIPVEVRGVKGNHDGQFEFLALMYTIKMMFEGDDRVEVDVTPSRYDAFVVGDTLHVLDHGYGYRAMSAEKTKLGAEMVARQFGLLGDNARYVVTWTGHLHAYAEEFGQHTIIRLPAFCESDEYETSIRYFHEPQAQLFRLAQDGRIDTVKRFYRGDLEG